MRAMNSAEGPPSNLRSDESAPGPDPNANLSDAGRGAVPKRAKPAAKAPHAALAPCATAKKAIKLNNNVENMSTLNAVADEVPKVNGVAGNGLCANRYLSELLEPSCSRDYCAPDTESDSDAVEADSDADTELSVSEDGCIYTYKGDNNADLPSSFFDIPPEIPENRQDAPAAEEARRQDASSPEMDYLEMDFDPSNNGDGDSASENEMPLEEVQEVPPANDQENDHPEEQDVEPDSSASPPGVLEATSPLQEIAANVEKWVENNASTPPALTPDEAKEMPWSCTLAQRTRSKHFGLRSRAHHARGELISPGEMPPPAALRHTIFRPEPREDGAAMIWTREEAALKHVAQIGPSSCGAAAVLNVLHALRFPTPPPERLRECVATRPRENGAPLTRYLMSRGRAGATHRDLIDGLHELSNGAIYARFFHMYPERVVNLNRWLAFWIGAGAVPIATANLQRCAAPGGAVPDAWHHQMIFGVSDSGVYLTNPVEQLEAGALWPQLCSESVLLVRRADVLARWNVNTDLHELMRVGDARWQRMNVVGQVGNIVHESARELRQGFTDTPHIRIPAAHASGITLATAVSSPAYALLRQAPELPLLGALEAHEAAR